ncbi:MAG: hypothetical protein DRN04_05485 [Thermoprotei archaeon]|nr:MAG: hypothetical protein DRN04_05485 [Thermoprotei archaeon]
MPVNKPVIVLAGQLGAGCTETAEKLAKKLGVSVVNSQLVIREIVAQERISFDELERKARSGELDLEDVVKSVVLDHIAERNVVIEGRVAFLVLDNPNIDIKVFLWAPENFRAQRIAKRRNISIEEALKAVRYSDEERKNLVYRLYRKDWIDADLYDAVINTSKWTFDEVAHIVEEIYKTRVK